jgi:hypothetical protein
MSTARTARARGSVDQPEVRVSGGLTRTARSHKPDLGNQVIGRFYECLGRNRG